jgi:hypothetical protein
MVPPPVPGIEPARLLDPVALQCSEPVTAPEPAGGALAMRLPPSIFDEAAVDRASRSIAAATPWSAFAPHPRTDAPNGMPWPPKPAETGQPDPAKQPDPTQPVGRAPVLGAQALLRQRVPGTHMAPMPTAPAGPNTTPPKATDAAAVKALVDDFELGVLRAERDERLRQPGPAANPPLTRRVPGVTLGALHKNFSSRPTVSETPPDPDEARSLVEQFEAGVTRALQEVRTDHQHEEGTPR